MKKWIAIIMAVGFASISQGQTIIDTWDFNIADTADLKAAKSTSEFAGGGGADWVDKATTSIEGGASKWIRAGTANFFVNEAPSVAGISGATSGEFECSWDIVTADFSNTALLDQKITWNAGLRGADGSDVLVRLQYEGQLAVTNVTVGGVTNIYADADHFDLKVKDALNNYVVAATFPGHTLTNLHVRMNYNLFNGTFDVYYTHDGGSETSCHNGSIASGWAIGTYRMVQQALNGGSIWEVGDELFMDNLTYTQIQEPFDPPALTLIDLWTYDDNTNGASLSEGASTGLVGGVTFSDADLASISNNMVLFQYTIVTNSQESIFRTATPSVYGGGTTGVYELAWDFVAADFSLSDATNGTGNVGMTIRDTANGNVSMGFRLRFDGNNFLLQMDDANGANQTMATFPGSTLSNLNVRLFLDLNNSGNAGSANLFYTADGGVEIAATYDGKVHPGFELSEYRMIVQTVNGGNTWQLGDAVWTDNLRFEKIAAMPVPPVYSDIVIYQMNDTAGTLLEGLAQTGSDSGQLAGSDSFIATDGIGNLVWSGVTNTTYRSHVMGSTFTKGLNALEFTFSDWDMDASTDGSAVKLSLFDDTGTNSVVFGMDVNTNNAGMRLRSAATGGDAGQSILPGYTTGTGIVMRIDANLDAGSYVASWKYTTDADFSVVESGSLGNVANISSIKFTTVDNGWDAGDFIKMDYATFSTTSDEIPWSPTARYEQWLDLYPALGASTNQTDDFDGDLYNNLYEYALGGDPTVANTANESVFGDTAVDGGTNYILYVYAKLKDNVSANRGLDYYLETNPNLVYGTWTNANYEWVGSGSMDAEFNAVTNRISTDALDAQFIQLKIDLIP